MTEFSKTSIALAAAAILTMAAISIRPDPPGIPVNSQIGEFLFPEFEDPLAAKNLEVVRYDEELASLQDFKVAEINGMWSIPSHNNYPADAENQMRDAATIVTDLEILGVATELANEHELYGVIEPADEIEAGQGGVGTLIAVQDEKGKDLARLVVGKKVRGNEEQRFVRRANQDIVYVVKIDPDKLSTKFEDWIETDLLDINTWDVKEILIKDYSVQTTPTFPPRISYVERMQMRLSLENSSDWNLEELLEDRDGELIPTELLSDEELNSDRLREAKDAFDDLKIVDIERKPPGLTKELRAESDFMQDNDNLKSLLQRGFYPVDLQQDGQLDLLSNDGEVLVRTDDGVEYVLRFGQITASLESGDDAGDLNRYLFVMARLWEDKFPDLASLEAAEDETSSDEEEDGDASTDDGSSEDERERDEKLEELNKAREKITKMNDRFANWYYIISEDVFKNIHLGRSDVIKTTEDSEEGFDVSTFRDLEGELEDKEETEDGDG
ncbi:MAG: DUF4340 domain-containing protein [Pirellulaceae bacterium]|nr:DUF4340 domain-containing protein [Pirellulaceae bacterium]